MKLSNKNRADIKKKQNKNFKKFLDEANPAIQKPEVFEELYHKPKRDKLHLHIIVYIVVAIIVVAGII